MFRIFVTGIFTIFSLAGAGQDTINVKDASGLRQGFWWKSDTAGHVVYEGHFKDNLPVGEFRYFYANGKIKTISVISDHGKRAATISYFPNGLKMATGNYLNEKKDSTWQFFNESTGTLASVEPYKEGRIDGVSTIYYPEGGLSEKRSFRLGVRDGLWEQFYSDGKIKLRGAFKDGEKDGPFRTYYGSGLLMISGQYVQGHQSGTWVYFTEKGVISKKEYYTKGILIKVEETPSAIKSPK